MTEQGRDVNPCDLPWQRLLSRLLAWLHPQRAQKKAGSDEPALDLRNQSAGRGMKLSLVGLPHLLEETLPGSSLLLLALDTRLFIVLALSHFRENASLLHLLLEAAESQIKVVVIEKNSGHENHLLPYNIGGDPLGSSQ